MRTTDRTTHIVGDTAIVRHTVTGDTERDDKTNSVTTGVLMAGTSRTAIGSPGRQAVRREAPRTNGVKPFMLCPSAAAGSGAWTTRVDRTEAFCTTTRTGARPGCSKPRRRAAARDRSMMRRRGSTRPPVVNADDDPPARPQVRHHHRGAERQGAVRGRQGVMEKGSPFGSACRGGTIHTTRPSRPALCGAVGPLPARSSPPARRRGVRSKAW